MMMATEGVFPSGARLRASRAGEERNVKRTNISKKMATKRNGYARTSGPMMAISIPYSPFKSRDSADFCSEILHRRGFEIRVDGVRFLVRERLLERAVRDAVRIAHISGAQLLLVFVFVDERDFFDKVAARFAHEIEVIVRDEIVFHDERNIADGRRIFAHFLIGLPEHELFLDARIVRPQEPDIGKGHGCDGEPFDAEAEGPAVIALDAHFLEDARLRHAAAKELQPLALGRP